ncbi:hypothetical protein M153_59460001, partial [Pseudoloma neurophilia]
HKKMNEPNLPVSKTPFLTGYTNLMKSILGVGVITYPLLFYRIGILPTIILMTISAMFSFLGLAIYLKLNYKKNKTITDLTNIKFINYFITFIIFTKCVAVSISYIITIRDIIYSLNIIDEFQNFEKGTLLKISSSNIENVSKIKKIIFILITFSIAPLSSLKSFSKLQFTSFLGLISVLMMLVISCLRFAPINPSRIRSTDKLMKLNENLLTSFYLRTEFVQQDFLETDDYFFLLLQSLGSFVYSFTCHQNVFSFSNECQMPLKRTFFCVITVIISCIIIYTIFGLLNAYIIGLNVFSLIKSKNDDLIIQGNNLNDSLSKGTANFFVSLPADRFTLFLKLFFLLVIIFAIPLQLNTVQKQINLSNIFKRLILSYLIHSVGLIVSFLNLNFNSIIKNIGGTVSSFLCFIIPGCLLFILRYFSTD